MARCALLCLLLGAASVVGCSFDSSNQLIEDDLPSDADIPQADALPIPDAEIPADAIQSCIPNASLCIDGTLETCRADGTGLDPALALDCNFACVDNDHCVTASNVNKSEVDACDGNYRPLSPSAGATVNISRENGSAVINCSPDCGDGATTQIVANAEVNVGGSPNLEVFCLSTITIPAGLTVSSRQNINEAIVFVVEGSVTIDGIIDISGGDATDQGPGGGGPGAGRGGILHDGESVNGVGPCRGLGGAKAGGSGNNVGGGGGGGGFGGNGGLGGEGQAPLNGDTAAGGNGGGTCGNAQLTPLFSGSGGGSGGDGTGGICGWPGGGGGGALQISSKTSIALNGSINSIGGNGFYAPCPDASEPLGGGGGGGSGGAVLLEAPVLTMAGGLSLEGGNGATTDAGDGGLGGSGGTIVGGNGASQTAPNQSGAGGGGGGGKVRLNATIQPDCAGKVSPNASCSTGIMSIQQP